MTEGTKGKVALVTGSTTGIGRGIAHGLAKAGCSVVLTGLGTDKEIAELLTEFQSQYKGSFHFVPGDFIVTEKTEKFANDVLAIYPEGIDILVNNAGLLGEAPIEDLTTKMWLDTVAVNLTAPFILTRAFFPLMKKKHWGRIINIASQMGLIADPHNIVYCSTKAGLLGFSRVAAIEGAKFGITCNAVCPGYTDAPMSLSIVKREAAEKGITYEEAKAEFMNQRSPMGRFIPLQEVVDLVVYLSSNSASCISGSPIPIDAANMAR
uniref:3-oxoacyl-[acyl-carrier-protein] reductase n=1 Tax=Arion vulgaris TaxID=1028688 RepID=A0A0B6ZAR2_9EUPU